MRYFFPKNDIKVTRWAANRTDVFVNNKDIFSFYLVVLLATISHIFGKNDKPVVFYRYLNVYRSALLECSIFLFDLLVFCLAYFGWLEIRWIAHNLDKETIDRWPGITKVRKSFLLSRAHKVFVTDPILEKIARRILGKDVIPISFGQVYDQVVSDSNVTEAINKLKSRGLRYVGVAANWVEKTSGVEELIAKVIKLRPELGIVYLCNNTTLKSEKISVIHSRSHFKLSDFDFCIKSLDDISIPFSIYHAISENIPIVHNSSDEFTIIFNEYDFGRGVEDVMIREIDPMVSVRFFEKRNWRLAGDKLFES